MVRETVVTISSTDRYGDKLKGVVSSFPGEADAVAYIYDGLGKMRYRQVEEDSAVTAQTWYRYDLGWNVLGEYADHGGSFWWVGGPMLVNYHGESPETGVPASENRLQLQYSHQMGVHDDYAYGVAMFSGEMGTSPVGVGRSLGGGSPTNPGPFPQPCNAAQNEHCKKVCLRQGKHPAKRACQVIGSFTIWGLCLDIDITQCYCKPNNDPRCKRKCPPSRIQVHYVPDDQLDKHPPQHYPCTGNWHWHYIYYSQIPFPDCSCRANRKFGGCGHPGTL